MVNVGTCESCNIKIQQTLQNQNGDQIFLSDVCTHKVKIF